MEDMESESNTGEDKKTVEIENTENDDIVGYSHIIVDQDCASQPIDITETDEISDDENPSDDVEDANSDDMFLASVIEFLEGTGRKNASLVEGLRMHQLSKKYGLDPNLLSENETIISEDVPEDNEVYEFS